jgi:hypothetical protein
MNELITIDSGIPETSSICFNCDRETGIRKCEAFPDEIPLAIWLGYNDHKIPFTGDHGIRFKQYKTKPA